MSNELAVKMRAIEIEFESALQQMPMANRQDEVMDVSLKGHTGICIRSSRYIWGITKAEYVQHYGII